MEPSKTYNYIGTYSFVFTPTYGTPYAIREWLRENQFNLTKGSIKW